MKKEKKLIFLVAIVFVATLICVVVGWFYVSFNQEKCIEIKTTYLNLQFPYKYKNHLAYEETLTGQNSEVIFFMNYEEKKVELFRLCVSADEPDSVMGYLNTNNGVMYVTLINTQVNREVFSTFEQTGESEFNMEMEALYFSMKECMSSVMQSVEQNPGYSVVMGVFENVQKDWQISNWKISLPAGISCEEKTEGNVYKATFFGSIGERKIMLYAILLGDNTANNPIGQYVVGGETKLISVVIYEMDESLSDDEKAAAYALMDTVNDVLQTIRQDVNFRDQFEPVG